jgi:hypothetical protein
MPRRLDKIEKEIGYCEIKLEKERRIRKQVQFLQDDIEVLDKIEREYNRKGLADLKESCISRKPKAVRDGFLCIGLLDLIREEKEILERERNELQNRLRTFTGFEPKRGILEEEKRNALKNLAPSHSSKLRQLNDDFKKVEKQWNAFTEDLVNMDEGIFFLDRNLDYLKSCRTLLISSKGDFDINYWVSGGNLTNLFRHSNIGRAKDMADGADRNLKMAQKELVCVTTVKIRPELFQRVLLGLLVALFEDIFVEGKFEKSFCVVDEAFAENMKLTNQIKEKRAALAHKVEQVEKLRNQRFSKLGANHKGIRAR